ncbi:MAG TPA: hypothetical protein PLN33_01080 [Hyphomonadaceae bacterium]|nr:hypothetical protein [Hyphomonadaceae bacterium]HPN06101.1 hypothetical protein [Hyphomonadaceae bacterium]
MRLGVQAVWVAGVTGLALFLPACGEKTETAGAPAAGETPAVAAASAPDAIAAMKAVFPEANAKGEVPIAAAGDNLARIERPVTVIAGTSGKSYLVTAKEQTDVCHACSASISVYYLTGSGGSLSVASGHPDLYESGGWGQAGDIAALALPRNGGIGMTDESGFTAQGCTVVNVSAYRFDDAGPKKILDRAPLAYSMDAADIGGKIIKPFTADADFAVNYTGNASSVPVDTTVTWQMQNGVLVQNSGRIPDAVAQGC